MIKDGKNGTRWNGPDAKACQASPPWRLLENQRSEWQIPYMTTMNAEVYDALKDAGASEDKARSAAESVSEYDGAIGRISSELRLIRWMVGFNLAFSGVIIWKVLLA